LIYVSRKSSDGTILGSGAFKLATWQPGARAVFTANEEHWEGRPFVDSIEVELGKSPREQLVDFELGKTDLIELAPDQLRGMAQSGKKTWSSAPVEFYFLATFSLSGDPLSNSSSEFRDALAAVIDRAAIHNVLLQKQGEVAGGCLPQWLSGYSYLLAEERNLDEARKARAKLPATLPPLTLAYDAEDTLARAIAERIALNAREIGVTLQVKPQNTMEKNARPNVQLLRRRADVPQPALAMDSVCPSTHWDYAATKADEMLQLYKLEVEAREQAPFRVPLFYLPEHVALSARVKNWMPYRWGEWRLADVWLAPDEAAAPAKNLPEKP
jgi:ABC-type transport system substrate-binding protein